MVIMLLLLLLLMLLLLLLLTFALYFLSLAVRVLCWDNFGSLFDY